MPHLIGGLDCHETSCFCLQTLAAPSPCWWHSSLNTVRKTQSIKSWMINTIQLCTFIERMVSTPHTELQETKNTGVKMLAEGQVCLGFQTTTSGLQIRIFFAFWLDLSRLYSIGLKIRGFKILVAISRKVTECVADSNTPKTLIRLGCTPDQKSMIWNGAKNLGNYNFLSKERKWGNFGSIRELILGNQGLLHITLSAITKGRR